MTHTPERRRAPRACVRIHQRRILTHNRHFGSWHIAIHLPPSLHRSGRDRDMRQSPQPTPSLEPVPSKLTSLVHEVVNERLERLRSDHTANIPRYCPPTKGVAHHCHPVLDRPYTIALDLSRLHCQLPDIRSYMRQRLCHTSSEKGREYRCTVRDGCALWMTVLPDPLLVVQPHPSRRRTHCSVRVMTCSSNDVAPISPTSSASAAPSTSFRLYSSAHASAWELNREVVAITTASAPS